MQDDILRTKEQFGGLRVMAAILEYGGGLLLIGSVIAVFLLALQNLPEKTVGLLVGGGGILIGAVGILLGQAMKCFVSIEHNTRLTNAMIFQLINEKRSKTVRPGEVETGLKD